MPTPTTTTKAAEWAFEASNGETSTETFDSSSVSYEPISDSVGIVEEIAPSESIMGSRWEFTDRSRITSETVSGQLVFEASPKVLGFWLPYITGDSSAPYTMNEGSYLDFDFMRSEPATAWLYRNCVVNQAVISPSNGRIRIALDITGKTGVANATFANAAIQTTNVYESYLEGEAAISLAGTTMYADSWQLTINTGLELFQRQSTTPNRTRQGPGSVEFNANVEWTATNENLIYNKGVQGIALTLTLSRAAPAVSTVFEIDHLVIPESPVGADGNENLWNFTGTSRRQVTGDTEILTVEHDENPA